VTYSEWEAQVPGLMKEDSLWRVEAYRLALFLSDLAWSDATRLLRDRRTEGIASQLYRATGKISANIAEGYSKCSGKSRALFYEYGLGSARESRDWYYKGRHVLGEDTFNHRVDLCSKIIRLTITMTSRERRSNRTIKAHKEEQH
jgi:four helix bundle protein